MAGGLGLRKKVQCPRRPRRISRCPRAPVRAADLYEFQRRSGRIAGCILPRSAGALARGDGRCGPLFILETTGKEEGIKDAIDRISSEITSSGGKVETVQKMDKRSFVRIA